jgi:hypothetical protein
VEEPAKRARCWRARLSDEEEPERPPSLTGVTFKKAPRAEPDAPEADFGLARALAIKFNELAVEAATTAAEASGSEDVLAAVPRVEYLVSEGV